MKSSLMALLLLVGAWAMTHVGLVLVYMIPFFMLWSFVALWLHFRPDLSLKKSWLVKIACLVSVPLFIFACFEGALLTYSQLILKQGGFHWWIDSTGSLEPTASPSGSGELEKKASSAQFGHLNEEEREQAEMYNAVGWDVPKHLWKRTVEVEGAQEAYYWMDILHVHGDRFIRRVSPIEPKRDGVERLLVLGDSFTYGQGVAAHQAYPAVLEQMFVSKGQSVEVINAGVCGASSEAILDNLKYFWHKAKPDQVIYGICMNDILPDDYWMIHPYDKNWGFPIPEFVKAYMYERTLSGRFLDRMYDQLLLKLGLRLDYRANLNKNAEQYSARFLSDLNAMAEFAQEKGLPVIKVMVLNNYPMSRDDLTARVEALVEKSGLDLIPSQSYMEKYDGDDWTVHIAERHPNATAHRVYAEMFYKALSK